MLSLDYELVGDNKVYTLILPSDDLEALDELTVTDMELLETFSLSSSEIPYQLAVLSLVARRIEERINP